MRSPVAALHARHHSACAELAKLASVFRITQTGTLQATRDSQKAIESRTITEQSREGEEQKENKNRITSKHKRQGLTRKQSISFDEGTIEQQDSEP